MELGSGDWGVCGDGLSLLLEALVTSAGPLPLSNPSCQAAKRKLVVLLSSFL